MRFSVRRYFPRWNFGARLRSRLDLQARISLVLGAVILPTFLVITLLENRVTQPLLEDDLRQMGVNSGKTLATELLADHLMTRPDPKKLLEARVQEFLYSRPNIVRMDIVVKNPETGLPQMLASSIEDDSADGSPSIRRMTALYETVVATEIMEEGNRYWDVFVPIEHRIRDPRLTLGQKKLLGNVHVLVSMKVIERVLSTLWKTKLVAAAFTVLTLLLFLRFFLRRTIENDRLLRRAETQNLELTEQLHEAQRQVMNSEKLAIMGQLTASFAHEIGTPLTAIGGHLQLLGEGLARPQIDTHRLQERAEIIQGQVSRIESIVKSFLQSTSKPSSQKQLVDLNRLVDQTLNWVQPRLDRAGIQVVRKFDRQMGPLRVVPIDFEQVILNLVNNALDSLEEKAQASPDLPRRLEIESRIHQSRGRTWYALTFFDTGVGIEKGDLKNVLRPFFTTKRPGQGTGLGLSICQEILRKYEGTLEIDSKEGAWAEFQLRIPYQGTGG